MSATNTKSNLVPSDGAGFQRIVNEIDRYGRTTVASYAGVSYQTICNYIWEQKTSESTRSKIAHGLFKAAQADIKEKKAEVLRCVNALQEIVDVIREELGTEFLSDCEKSKAEDAVLSHS